MDNRDELEFQLNKALLKLIQQKYPNKIFRSEQEIVSEEYFIKQIIAILQSGPRIQAERVASQLKTDVSDIVQCVSCNSDTGLEIVYGDVIHNELYVAQIQPLIQLDLNDFVSLQTLCSNYDLPADWMKRNCLKQADCWIHSKTEFYCSVKVIEEKRDKILQAIPTIKSPVNLYEYLTNKIGFIPQSFYLNICASLDFSPFGKFSLDRAIFTPNSYTNWQVEEAERQLELNEFIDESFCSNILQLNRKEILEFMTVHLSSYPILKEKLFVFKQHFLDSIVEKCNEYLNEAIFKPFSFSIPDEILTSLLKVAKLNEFILVKNGYCFSKISLIDEGKNEELFEGEIKTCLAKLKTCTSCLFMEGFDRIAGIDNELAETMKKAYLLNNTIIKGTVSSFYTSYSIKKKQIQLERIVELSNELPIVMHASLQLQLMKKWPDCLFEFTGKFIPPLLVGLKNHQIAIPQIFFIAKEAISNRDKNVEHLLADFKSLIRNNQLK